MKKLDFLVLLILVCVSLLLITGLPIGCGVKQVATVPDVTFNQLFANPDKYKGRQVNIEGFFYQGFETIVLADQLEYSGYAEGHIVPGGPMLWIEGGIPREIYDKLHQQQMMGPIERYGKLRIEGLFEYGGKYGHLGAYGSQIVLSEVEFLLWSPPGKQ